MTNRILGLALALALFASISFRAEANLHWRPYHTSFIYNGATIGWGNWGWPVVSYPNYPVYYQYPYYGASYWSYYNYQPYYATYAALAYSKETGEVGIAWGNATRQIAEKEAVGYCGKPDCTTVLWTQGGCAALSKSEISGNLGYAYAPNRRLAESRAFLGCKKGGDTDCEPLAWVCSW